MLVIDGVIAGFKEPVSLQELVTGFLHVGIFFFFFLTCCDGLSPHFQMSCLFPGISKFQPIKRTQMTLEISKFQLIYFLVESLNPSVQRSTQEFHYV